MYHDVHEACQLMDIFVNTENVMLLFLFVSFLSLCLFTLNLLHVAAHCFIRFFSSSFVSFPHFVHYLCPVPALFFLSVLPPHPPPSSPLFLSVWISLSFLSSSSPHLSPFPAGWWHRKMVDCPQLLDVDDMVKMREPDWKCVYTYLQEFYRGLVTKGLVKTKNSS